MKDLERMKDRLSVSSTDQLKSVVFGGKGILTVKNPNTGEEHTFSFKKKRGEKKNRLYVWHSVGDYEEYVGMILDGKFSLTMASQCREGELETRTIRYILGLIEKDSTENAKMNLFQATRCPVCGKVLTKPESIERGIGPKCAEKMISMFSI